MRVTPEAAFGRALDYLLDGAHGRTLGVAVSGGGDSMALLLLARDWAHAHDFAIRAATVDHGLRPEAKAEATFVAGQCAKRGIPHDVLRWTGWDGSGNLMAEARAARRALLGDWAERLGLSVVMLGHTADDQAETFLMRLARGSGVDGLAGMSADDDPLFLRPLLTVRREALREVLRARDVPWIEDPTNDDARFDRIKARQMLPLLEDLGLTVDRVLATMAHMNRARISLGHAAAAFADRHVRAEAGDLILAREALAMIGGDSPGRVLAAAIRWIGGRDYRPRYAALTEMAAALRAGEARTLNGVRMLPETGGVRLTRELAAARDVVAAPEGASIVMWDRRWALRPPQRSGLMRKATPGIVPPGLTIRALGEDIALCKGWRDTGLPRASLMATPAIYRDAALIAAPVAGLDEGWSARIVADFRTFLLSH